MHHKKRKERDQAFTILREYVNEARRLNDVQKSTVLLRKARRLAQKFRLRLPRNTKRLFCSHCYTYLKMGENARVRVQPGHVVYSCLSCKKYMRFPIRAKIPAK